MTVSDFAKKSYELHRAHESEVAEEVPSIIAAPGSIDAFVHERMYRVIAPIYSTFPNATWLTIGDSGGDAYFLKQQGVAHVTSTSISAERLNELKDSGVLEGIQVDAVNAEEIHYEDRSFDIVFCKEAYHHFPRPPLAFYEFLRVARKCVILIEPAEKRGWRLLDTLKIWVKALLRTQSASKQMFEPSGNFLFRLSDVEVLKMATALQLQEVALKFSNVFYLKYIASKRIDDRLFKLVETLGLQLQDVFCALSLMNYGLVTSIIFKEPPTPELRETLARNGFRIVGIPRNPYLE